MSGEYITKSQLLLQYYSALAELEQESRVMPAHAKVALPAVHITEQARLVLLKTAGAAL